MRWLLSLAAGLMLFGAGNAALAQPGATHQGPILVPPTSLENRWQSRDRHESGSVYGGTTDQRSIVPRFSIGGRDSRDYLHSDVIRFEDPRMRQVAAWYRQFFGREMVRAERINWEDHFGRGGTLDAVLVSLLGSRDFYLQAGGKFESWLAAVADATDVRLRRDEFDLWHDAYHREPDRFSFTKRFLTTQGVLGRGRERIITGYRPGMSSHDLWDLEHDRSGPAYGAPSYGGYSSPGLQGRPPGGVPPYIADPHHHQEHTTGYAPRPAGPAAPDELIAGWYRTYFGRDIAPPELNKWLSDLNKGVSLDEVYASVLAAPEWYSRTGSSPPSWIAATLQAQGAPADRDAVNRWLNRFERNDGDRYETALEMVRSLNVQPESVLPYRDRDRRDRRERRHDWDD